MPVTPGLARPIVHPRRRPRALVVCIVLGAALVGVGAASGAAPGQVKPAAPPSELSRRASERLRWLRAEADALLKQERSLLGTLRAFEVERDLRAEQLRALETEAAAVEEELAATSSHLAALKRARDEQAPLLRQRLVELYKLGAPGYVRLLAGVDDLRDAGRAYRTITALAAFDRERVRAHASTLASLQRARDDLAARQASLARLRAATAAARAGADAAVRDRNALIASIDARRDLNAQLTGELQAAQQKLQQAVGGMASGDAALPLRPFKGTLDWPVPGRVIARFGAPGRGAGAAPRTGVEIAATREAAVAAIHEGVVAYAAPFAGFGNLVIVDHGSHAFSLYGYLGRVSVERGGRVTRGQAIGVMGTSPTGAAALYFELRVDGRAVDPLQWLRGRP